MSGQKCLERNQNYRKTSKESQDRQNWESKNEQKRVKIGMLSNLNEK